jgi:antitoxin component HigA of HigAB toxin-antitoxin module
MIQNEAQLRQALEQIQNLCAAVDSLRADIFAKNPRNFAILAEGPLEQIRQLQGQVDEYVRHLEAAPA